jgi:DNA-binding response OmpR family regulator
MKILIIEDEKQLADVLSVLLSKQNYTVDVAYDGISGEEKALSHVYEIILLDIMLPGKNGLDVLSSIREEGIDTPILLLTAKSDVEDRILGLDQGADDYLSKPFDSGELLARIRAMIRRSSDSGIGDNVISGATTLNLSSQTVSCHDSSVRLGLKEFQILDFLMRNHGIVISKERLIERIWGYDYDVEYNAIEVYISFIRRKLVAIDADIEINTIRGVGYSLDSMVQNS